ncbi:MAG: hypothetical protein ACI4TE_09320 [Alphaproteobacteria bacterium]
MMKVFCLFLLFCLAGCADRYSLDKGRGPDPQGIVTGNPLVLPPDYLLRAPEPAAAAEKPADSEKNQTEKKDPPATPEPQAAVQEEIIEISGAAATTSAEE